MIDGSVLAWSGLLHVKNFVDSWKYFLHICYSATLLVCSCRCRTRAHNPNDASIRTSKKALMPLKPSKFKGPLEKPPKFRLQVSSKYLLKGTYWHTCCLEIYRDTQSLNAVKTYKLSKKAIWIWISNPKSHRAFDPFLSYNFLYRDLRSISRICIIMVS